MRKYEKRFLKNVYKNYDRLAAHPTIGLSGWEAETLALATASAVLATRSPDWGALAQYFEAMAALQRARPDYAYKWE